MKQMATEVFEIVNEMSPEYIKSDNYTKFFL